MESFWCSYTHWHFNMALKLVVLAAIFFTLKGHDETVFSRKMSEPVTTTDEFFSAIHGQREGTAEANIPNGSTLASMVSNTTTARTHIGVDTASHNGDRDHMIDREYCLFFKFMFGTVGIGTLTLFGLIGNTLSFVVLFQQRKTSASMLILLALTVTDSFFVLTMFTMKSIPALVFYTGLLPGYTYYYPYFFVYGWPTVSVALVMTSYTTVLIAVHRFVAVCKPFALTTFASIRNTQYQIAGVFIFSIIYNIPIYNEYTLYTVTAEDGSGTTSIKWRYSGLGTNYYYSLIYRIIMYYLIIFIGPLIVLLVISIKLIRALRKAQKSRSKMSLTAQKKQERDEITPALIVIVIVYFICQAPVFTRRFLQGIFPNSRGCGTLYLVIQEISALSTVCNSSVNFLIYIIMSKGFRNTLIGIVRSVKRRSESTSDAKPSTTTKVTHVSA